MRGGRAGADVTTVAAELGIKSRWGYARSAGPPLGAFWAPVELPLVKSIAWRGHQLYPPRHSISTCPYDAHMGITLKERIYQELRNISLSVFLDPVSNCILKNIELWSGAVGHKPPCCRLGPVDTAAHQRYIASNPAI